MKTRAAFMIIGIFLLPLTSFGQELEFHPSLNKGSLTKVELERTISLAGDSETEEVVILVKEGTARLEMQIQSQVGKGKVTIEIYDPKGTKQGQFSVGTLLNSEKEEMVNGNIRRSMVEPQPGKWKVKIIPKDAFGRIQIRTAFAELKN